MIWKDETQGTDRFIINVSTLGIDFDIKFNWSRNALVVLLIELHLMEAFEADNNITLIFLANKNNNNNKIIIENSVTNTN